MKFLPTLEYFPKFLNIFEIISSLFSPEVFMSFSTERYSVVCAIISNTSGPNRLQHSPERKRLYEAGFIRRPFCHYIFLLGLFYCFNFSPFRLRYPHEMHGADIARGEGLPSSVMVETETTFVHHSARLRVAVIIARTRRQSFPNPRNISAVGGARPLV